MEILGIFIALLGCVLTTFDPSAQKVEILGEEGDKGNNILLGDTISLISSFSGALYFTLVDIHQKQKNVSQLFVLSQVNLFTTFYVCLFYLVGVPESRDIFNPEHGLLFFFTPWDRLFYSIFILGILTGTTCMFFYSTVIYYFSPLVLCTAFLFEPLFAQAIGCQLGLDLMPGIVTVAGSLITMIGLFLVGANGPSDEEEAEKEEIQA